MLFYIGIPETEPSDQHLQSYQHVNMKTRPTVKIVQPIEISRHSEIQFVWEESENKITIICNHINAIAAFQACKCPKNEQRTLMHTFSK